MVLWGFKPALIYCPLWPESWPKFSESLGHQFEKKQQQQQQKQKQQQWSGVAATIYT